MIRRPITTADTSTLPSRKRRTNNNNNNRSGSFGVDRINLVFCFMVGISVLWVGAGTWLFLTTTTTTSTTDQSFGVGGGTTGNTNEDGASKPAPQQQQQQQQQQKESPAAKLDGIVNVLMELAQMPSEQLRNMLEGSDGEKDPFQLQALEQGECPFSQQSSSSIDWLPDRPIMSQTAAQWFQNPQASSSTSSPSSSVVVYYEHLSKAGGTSFCKLAQSNMAKKEVPSYYCMPSEPGKVDARVGSWTEQKLQDYVQSHPHRLVSNEWEPFNHAFLERFQPTQLQQQIKEDANSHNDLILLFVTSIRHPINRLLSAYKFWGILHNPAEKKPSLDLWLHRYGNRSKKWKINSPDFTANVGNFNFATWKFSGGKLPTSDRQLHAPTFLSESTAETDFEAQTEDIWKEPFETAVRTLARFDLAIPMEYLSDHTAPLTNLLGWTNFDKSHVVPSGKIINNEATKELSPLQYAKLWDANKLDIILYRWTCAVYLARLYCNNLQ